MEYGSVCSGIEAASVAWEPLGFKPAWFSEIEKFPSAVLDHHWPDVSNWGDMTQLPRRVLTGEITAPDILVGGTPCQSFSVAGLREGMNDERGQLTIKYVELLNAIDAIRRRDNKPAAIAVWENVPGVLSDKSNAFGCFLGALAGEDCELEPAGKKWTNAGCVYGPERTVAWRILDAQYFGLAQRRRRVFVVASARNDFDPAAVFLELDSVRRDSAPRREAPQDIAGTITSGSGRRRGAGISPSEIVGSLCARSCLSVGVQDASSGHLISTFDRQSSGKYGTAPVASTVSARDYKSATDLICIHGTQDPCVSDKAFALGRNSGQENVIAFSCKDSGADAANEMAPTLRSMNSVNSNQNAGGQVAVAFVEKLATRVRRLTPVECERLQGFPDDHTKIPWRNKTPENCPDGPRYKACGNSMAVPVMRWIGERIQQQINRNEAAL